MTEPQTFDPSKPFSVVETPPPPQSREDARAALSASLPRFKPLPDKIQKFATDPLLHVTGNHTIDSLTSPLNIVLTATLGARSAAKALTVGAEAISAGVDSELVSKTLKFLTPTKFKEGLDLLTTLAKKAGSTAASEPVAAPVEPVASGPGAPVPPSAVPAPPAGPVAPSTAPAPSAASAPSPGAPSLGKALDGGPVVANPSPQQLANEVAIARRRAAYQAQLSSAPPVPAPVPAPPPVKLSAAETKAFLDLMKRGMSGPDAMRSIQQQRALIEQLGTPTPTAADTRFPKGMRGKTD